MAKLININRPFTEYNRAHGTKNTLLDGKRRRGQEKQKITPGQGPSASFACLLRSRGCGRSHVGRGPGELA